MTWSVANTHPGLDDAAAKALRLHGLDVLHLQFRTKITHARRVREELRPYFPRYIFVNLGSLCGIDLVLRTPGVAAILTVDKRPAIVPECVIEELRARCDRAGIVPVGPKERRQRRRFRPGASVWIHGGPWAGFMGLVQIDNGKALKVWAHEVRNQGHGCALWLAPEQVSAQTAA